MDTTYPHDRGLAEAVLRRLLHGSSFAGVRFGAILQLLIDHHSPSLPPIQGQVYINLASRWTVFKSRPTRFPEQDDELSELTVEEQVHLILGIRERVIQHVELGADNPHLIITLDTGEVFFLCGNDQNYESWDVGVARGDRNEYWHVVAVPGGDVAIWAPESFQPTLRPDNKGRNDPV